MDATSAMKHWFFEVLIYWFITIGVVGSLVVLTIASSANQMRRVVKQA